MSLLSEVLSHREQITFDAAALRKRLIPYLAKAMDANFYSAFPLKKGEPFREAAQYLEGFGLVVEDYWLGRPGEDPYYLALYIQTPDGPMKISKGTIGFLKDPEGDSNE